MEIVNKEAGGIPLQAAFFLGAFALGTSENVIAGMLPQLSASLGISIAQTGLLITAYAGTAVVAGPLLAILTSTMRPFGLTATVVALYTVGSLLAAFAPTFGVLMAARILTGAMHTTILVMFILTAMETAAPERKARTIGRITLGLGVATVVGVPIGRAEIHRLRSAARAATSRCERRHCDERARRPRCAYAGENPYPIRAPGE